MAIYKLKTFARFARSERIAASWLGADEKMIKGAVERGELMEIQP